MAKKQEYCPDCRGMGYRNYGDKEDKQFCWTCYGKGIIYIDEEKEDNRNNTE